MSRADQIAAEANATVSSWPSMPRVPGDFIKCQSGGYLVEVGDSFPVWREDMGAVRRLLAERDLMSAIAGATA